MHRPSWDWPRLVALGGDELTRLVSVVSTRLARTVSVVVDYHLVDDEGYEQERVTATYSRFDGGWWKRGAPASAEEIADRLREVDQKPDWWSDVWIVADFEAHKVETMTPVQAAQALAQFKPLRDVLRGRRA